MSRSRIYRTVPVATGDCKTARRGRIASHYEFATHRLSQAVDQLLVYPRTAADEEFPSHHEFAEGHLLTRKTILWFHQHYRASDADRRDFRYAPLIADDLSRLPPALIIVGECDPLRDDGIAYADRLKHEGDDVELTNYPGMVHPFFSMGGAVDAGRRAIAQSARALRRAFTAAKKRPRTACARRRQSHLTPSPYQLPSEGRNSPS